MPYVDVILLPVGRDRIDDYLKVAERAAALWKEHGALDYVEWLGDRLPHGELTSFPRAVLAEEGEHVVLAWITYPSREARDDIFPRIMADPRMAEIHASPADGKRMIFGGFVPLMPG